MKRIRKIIFYSFLTILVVGFGYLYLFEKPKLELWGKTLIETMAEKDLSPFRIQIGRANLSIIPLQVELYDTEFFPKKKISQTIDSFKVDRVIVRPSLIDLIIGKVWVSYAEINGTELNLKLKKSGDSKKKGDLNLDFDLDETLKRIPLSQLNIENVKLNINYNDQWFVSTENLFLKAFNEKSSLILTLKDPNIGVTKGKEGETLNFLAELQLMLTKNTLSLSKIKIVKDDAFVLASGNIIHKNNFKSIDELKINNRIKIKMADLRRWSNIIHKNDYFEGIDGGVRADIHVHRRPGHKNFKIDTESELKSFKIGKVKLGDFLIKANMPDEKQVHIEYVKANLAGGNPVEITDGKVTIDKRTDFSANVALKGAQLQSFLKDSGITDIPVWLKINGDMKCTGYFEKKLNVDCPGALTVTNLKVQTGSSKKTIIESKKINIAGSMKITEKAISYNANAEMPNTKGTSQGVIDFDKGFDIKYATEAIDLGMVSPIADLSFRGITKISGGTSGDSKSAIFSMDIKSDNFEFQDYFFGTLNTKLRYKSGSLYFENLEGNIESTRYNGQLQVDLLKEKLIGDIRLPFFRMEDVQQAILKKVDLEKRFTGSGSGRLQLDSPLEVERLNFLLEARLFKGSAFGEDYNEAKLKAQAIDGIIVFQEAKFQREKTKFILKGTVDTGLIAQLQFVLTEAYLQHSTNLKAFNFPIAGEFDAEGNIDGPVASPQIVTKANIKNLSFNKRKYGPATFRYDNTNKQTNLKFAIPDNLDLLAVFPENNTQEVFIDLTSKQFDVAPLVGFMVSDVATNNYEILIDGEASGQLNMNDFWASEFSSTIGKIDIDYKANQIVTTIPTNIEMKNNKLYFNELSLIGDKQYVKITQPYTEKFTTKFIINARMNIAFFKILAPFIEKIDGFSTLRLELAFNKKNLTLYGSSDTADAFVKFPGFPHAFENLAADVLFTQNKVLINSISGQLADGDLLGNGEIKILGPKNFDVSINTSLENLNLRFPEGFNSQGRANLTLSGKKLPFLLAGTYTVTGGLIDSNFDDTSTKNSSDLLEQLLKQEVTAPLALDIDIKTENSVEMRNQLVDGFIRADMKVFDLITTPRLRGEAHFEERLINPSIVRFSDTEFEVTQSSFLFEGQYPINPKLSLRATTRINSYDVDMFLQGRANNPDINLTSQPPLPQSQIVSMLALGQLPDQFNQATANTAANDQNNNQNAGFEIGTSLLGNNPLGRELKERWDLDVQFSSAFDEQNNTAVPKVTVRKRLGKNLQISGSQTTGNVSQSEGRVTYELNDNLSTIFRITNFSNDATTTDNNNQVQQNNPFGVDLQYQMEFD